jgi:hypothetical protein
MGKYLANARQVSVLSLKYILSPLFFEPTSHYVAQAGLKHAMYFKLASNPLSSCLCLPNTRITGMNHNALWNKYDLGFPPV